MRVGLVVALLVLGGALPASAEQRFAVLIGSNPGWSSDRPLRYAENDAEKLRDALVALEPVLRAEQETRTRRVAVGTFAGCSSVDDSGPPRRWTSAAASECVVMGHLPGEGARGGRCG